MVGKTEGIIRSAKGVFDFFFKIAQFKEPQVVTRHHLHELILLYDKLCRLKVYIFVVKAKSNVL